MTLPVSRSTDEMMEAVYDGVTIVDTGILLAVIEDERRTQRDVCALYAVALRMNFGQTDYGAINKAIVQRWSMSGLKAIKRRAWRAVEEADQHDRHP